MPNNYNNVITRSSTNADREHKQQPALDKNTSSRRIQRQQRNVGFTSTLVVVVAMLVLLASRQQVAASTTTTLDRQFEVAARHGWFGLFSVGNNRKLEEQDEENDEENIQDDQQQQEDEEEEEEEDQEEDQDDKEEGEGDDNEEEEENSRDNQIEQDDFFEDALADDAVVSDHGERNWHYDDDFYAFIGDPAPPTLLPLQGRYIVGYIIACLGLMLGRLPSTQDTRKVSLVQTFSLCLSLKIY